MPINSLFRLYNMVLHRDPILENASLFLMIPDILGFWLTTESYCEYTIATTSQCYSVPRASWAYDVLDVCKIPSTIFPHVVKPGTIVGNNQYPGLPPCKVIATISHDTAAAIAATPLDESSCYISLGTWALIGMEVSEPILTTTAMKAGFSNEGGWQRINFHANKTGMWLIEECNTEWRLPYEKIMQLASAGKAFQAFFNPDDPKLFTPGKITEKLTKCIQNTCRVVIKDIEDLCRAILENLVISYKHSISRLKDVTGKDCTAIYIVGGGARNDLLAQWVADATGKVVVAGLYEAASIGNGLGQLIALGEIEDLTEGRRLVSASFEFKHFTPQNTEGWERAYRKWLEIIGRE